MVIKGELDLSNNYLPGIAALSSQGVVKTYYAAAPFMLSANTAMLYMNLTMKPLDDPQFRKALAYSINVADIVNSDYGGLVNVASPTGLLPALKTYVDQATVTSLGFSYNPAKAKSILAAAGYKVGSDGFVTNKDGSPILLHVTCPNGWTDWMAAIKIIAASAQAVGINIITDTPDAPAWTTAQQTGTFELTLNNNTNLTNTPWTLYNTLFYHPIVPTMLVGNFERYDNQAMFDAVDALAKLKLTDTAAMQAATKKIQEIMLTDTPVIPLWYNGMWAQWSNAVWTGESTEGSAKQAVPSTWNGYWQTGGLDTLLNLTPVTP
jgi:peptide/nickel transport system substrate-binding protein